MKSIDELAILTALHCLYCDGNPVGYGDLLRGAQNVLREIGVSEPGDTLAVLDRMAEEEIGMIMEVESAGTSVVFFPKQKTLAEALDEAPF